MRALLLLLALLCFSLSTGATDIVTEVRSVDMEIVTQDVCTSINKTHTSIKCEEIASPIPVISWAVDYIVYTGRPVNGIAFCGEPYVFINTGADDIVGVLYHEVGHYVVCQSGLDLNVCEEENVVRKAAGQEWGPTQRALYSCTDDDLPIVKKSP